MNIKRGQAVGAYYTGYAPNSMNICNLNSAGEFTIASGRHLVSDREGDLSEYFYEVLDSHGYKTVGDPKLIFQREEELAKAKFKVAARITDMKINICNIYNGWDGANMHKSQGEAWMAVEWSVYSSMDRETLLRIPTDGHYLLEKPTGDGEFVLFAETFASAAEELAADKDFYKMLSGELKKREPRKPLDDNELTVAGVPLRDMPFKSTPERVVDGVATIILPSGHGSGFLISKDGYMLTNYHVAGGLDEVKVRFKSGIELPAKVIRAHKLRDVALIKVDLGNAPALALRAAPVKVTERVYAIGTPRLESLSNTVSTGVVSALRVDDDEGGLPLIQSDVDTHGGNSGGPLVDENGNVVAICVAGYSTDASKASIGLNFFIPITSALEYLRLRVVPAEE
ncbi:MAG: trypsin-like peptidase domain-containing protein [Desulfovibrionaceae bacterium]|nr:trypsin-like peptidase domain-containing protein [Desulfovibrionaceae bacterium]